MAAKREPNEAVTTPKGYVIRHWASIGVDGEPQRYRYTLNGEKVPSATTISGQFDKPGMLISAVNLTREGKDYRAEWDQRATQGTVTHDRVVNALKDGKTPPELDEWTKGAFDFWTEVRPKLLAAEQVVGSVRHSFAGRFDLLCSFPNGLDLPNCKADPGTVGRLDLKTKGEIKRDRKGIPYPPYDEHFIQLELYEMAAQESGYPSSDFRAVLNVGPEGEWELYFSPANVTDALVCIDAFHMRASLGRRIKDFAGVPA